MSSVKMTEDMPLDAKSVLIEKTEEIRFDPLRVVGDCGLGRGAGAPPINHELWGLREMVGHDSRPRSRQKLALDDLNEFFASTTKRWNFADDRQSHRETRALLAHIYQKTQEWRASKRIHVVIREIQADLTTSDDASVYLMILRCLYPSTEMQKRMSTWASVLEYAEYQKVDHERFEFFLHQEGGIDSVRRKMAAIRRE